METLAYNPTRTNITTELYSFLSRSYFQHKNFNFFLSEYQNAFRYCLDSRHISCHPIMVKRNDQLLGHVALIRDDRLNAEDAFFGFLEFVDDSTVFTQLWQQLTSLARKHNISTIKGPVNGSIWHQYRCIKEDQGDEYSKTEPITPPHHYSFLSRITPHNEVSFSSGSRQSFTPVIEILNRKKNIIKSLQANGFSIQCQKKLDPQQLLAIINLSKLSFAKSWGYTNLDNDELANLYSVQKINANIDYIYLLYKDRGIIGYCSTIEEDQILNCKTICIKPEFQKLGLGNALALAVHNDALNKEIKEIKYLLVRDGNQVHNYPTDDLRIFRRYAAFDFILNQ